MDKTGELYMKFNDHFFFHWFVVLTILIVLSSIPMVYAEIQTLGTFKKNQCVELLQTCSNCTYVNISSVVYPNSTQALGQVAMTKTGTKYNYTFCLANYSGTYIVNGYGDVDGLTTVYSYDFDINPQGIEPSEMRSSALSRSVYFFFGIAILLFLGFMFINSSPPFKWTFFIIAVIFFIIGLDIITITITDEVVNPQLENFFDSFLALSFYFYWFAGGVLAVMWGMTFINTWIYKKNMDAFRRFG